MGNTRTRAECASPQGERPCYVNSPLDLLPQLRSARWRWPLPLLPLIPGAAHGVAIITSAVPTSATSPVPLMSRRRLLCHAPRDDAVRLPPAQLQRLLLIVIR